MKHIFKKLLQSAYLDNFSSPYFRLNKYLKMKTLIHIIWLFRIQISKSRDINDFLSGLDIQNKLRVQPLRLFFRFFFSRASKKFLYHSGPLRPPPLPPLSGPTTKNIIFLQLPLVMIGKKKFHICGKKLGSKCPAHGSLLREGKTDLRTLKFLTGCIIAFVP